MLLADMHDTSVTNKGLSFFWGSGSCIQLARASDCLKFILSKPEVIAQ